MTDVTTIQHILFRSTPFVKLADVIHSFKQGEALQIQGVAGSLLAFILCHIVEERQRQIIVIASDRDKAEKLYDDCLMMKGKESVLFFGERPSHEAAILDLSSPLSQIETLQALAKGTNAIVIASPNSIAQKTPNPDAFVRATIELNAGEEYDFQKLLEQLTALGLEKKNFVEGYGDFAVRGGILDIYSFANERPLRFEFWGNTIESIREFDVLSQRSIRKLEKASIVPSFGITPGISLQDSQSPVDGYTSSLFDYLNSDALIVLDEPEFIKKELEEAGIEASGFKFQNVESFANETTTTRQSAEQNEEGIEANREQMRNVISFDDILEFTEHFSSIHSSWFSSEHSAVQSPKPIIDFNSISQPSFNGSVNVLVKEINKLSKEGISVYLSCDTKKEGERLNELIEEAVTSPDSGFQDSGFRMEDPREESHLSNDAGFESFAVDPESRPSETVMPAYKLFTQTFHSGFIYKPAKLAVFTEHELFGRLKRRGLAKRKRAKGISQKELMQLKPGDFVVHVDRGIGKFSKLQKIMVAGVEQEVMKLEFDEGGILYVNLQLLNKVQKYASKEGFVPRLNKLGSGDWERVTSRAKKRIKDIARDLIKLYAKRKLEKGFAFNPDSHWQKELEASFMYEDTPDQASTTLDVKKDMESSAPMDRLVCGDVGFGKTEVAVRAAFKAVNDGKQVAVLVPTTILAMQHHNTFLDRLSKYAVRCEHLTRFKTTKEQKVIIEALKAGSVDIIIGTHRLLSKDISLKDLGLLIIDEEHRFGVAAKEKLRQFRAAVDTLALTATPIPRTLQFSLLGARDLSVIGTPPRNRLPIQTEIIPAGTDGTHAHWHIIRETVIHELRRGGQIYFVHDRVDNIDAIAGMFRSKIPEAKVHVAHGQMEGHELEQTMIDFLEKKYDVLICTKIIESGLDIPSVNTIIINRADRFGMAELHQLRGRVGRSNTQAYAYLLTPPLNVLPKPTLRRLQAIEEFAELGSGFNLSMRDLEIRGAGNMLGAEQSGFVADMGFEMYERILREAVEEIKKEEFEALFKDETQTSRLLSPVSIDTVVETNLDAYIPDFYIESSVERLDFYRRLSRTQTAAELQEMRDELQDRFGEYPDVVENLFGAVDLRILGTSGGFQKIEIKNSRLTIVLPLQSSAGFYEAGEGKESPFQKMINVMKVKPKGMMKLEQDEKDLKVIIRLSQSEDAEKSMEEVKAILVELLGR